MRISRHTTRNREQEIIIEICLLSGLLATILALAASVAH